MGEGIAHVFRSKEGGNVILIVQNSKGKNITTISAADFEDEILHRAGRRFEKRGQLPGQDPITGENVTEVIIRQLDD